MHLESFCEIWMNVILAKIVALSYLYAQEFSIMNMPYEMFLTIQLVHFTCRKDCLKYPTRKQGYDALLSRHGGVAECRWNLP